MTRDGKIKSEISTAFSPVRTRRHSGRQVEAEKDCLQTDSSEEEIQEPSRKRKRRENVDEPKIINNLRSRPRTRSFNLDVEVESPRDLLKSNSKLQNVSSTKTKSSKKQGQSSKKDNETKGVRRSHRESRKVFESLNEHTLVRNLVGDYLHPNSELGSRSAKKRRALLDEVETDSQGENPSGYVSMYDRIKSKSKSDKEHEDDEDKDEDEESGSDDDDDDDDDDEDDDDDDTPQQRYKLRENKPITKRYTAPAPKSYHSSRRGLFSGSRHHVRERACADKQPFSPVRKTYKLKRKTINESSTSSDDDDDDDRKFERRKAKSLVKARNRCLPMNLAVEDVNKGVLADRERIGSSLADVDPMNIDRSITFESIGGLGKHVRSLKEMVVFPLLYPEVFEKFKVNPPRGVLFHGPPGTGKTLMARALANECSQDGKNVAFFMRKGADCLSKWVGESERQLRLLFDQAFKMRPSIIFFDEIDGLAPVRSSRQDQIHSSIVSTLLALMDGLDNRGEIVVIGATNRIDSIDPALRRPGRFDREFIFPLPNKQARRNILSIHTKAWQPRLVQNFINEVADQCVGYCGADIKALCTEATLFALRRRYPQIYASKKKLVLDVNTVRVSGKDFAKAIKTMVPAHQRAVVSPGRALSSSIRPLLHEVFTKSWNMVTTIFPPALFKTVGESSPGSSVNFGVSDSESSDDAGDEADIYEIDPNSSEGAREARAARAARRAGIKFTTFETGDRFHYFAENTITSKLVHRPRFLVCGKRGMGQSTHVSPSILHSMEHIPVHCLDLPALFGCASKTAEEACAQIFREARRVAPSIIYLPHVDSLWSTTTDTLKATFLSLVNDLPPNLPLLLFATCDLPISKIPHDLSMLFSLSCEQVFEVPYPTAKERSAYLEPLFLNEAVKQPCVTKPTKTKKPLEVLPVASAPEPRELSVGELEKMREHEENTLRELRIFLREITVKLMSDRKFKEFHKPVDLEEVTDYLDVIENPMDLTTMLQKIDGHQYQTCAEYLLDINLITSNALEYNPNEDNFDRLVRHRACALKDCANSLIKSQLDPDFEKACEEIAESRKRRGDSRNVCAPKFFPVAPVKVNNSCPKPEETEPSTRMSRRVRGLAADVDIQLECLPLKSISGSTKRTDTNDKKESEVVEISNEKKSPKRKNHRRRRSRFRRKSTPARNEPQTQETSDPEIEETNEGTKGAVGENMGETGQAFVHNGHDDALLTDGKECQSKDLDLDSVKTLSTIEEELSDKRESNSGNPDAFTNHYINSLRMRSDVKIALKSHLDNLNNDEPNQDLMDKDHLSEPNLSMATSEISNCDSKDFAELDSMLSTSPHHNGNTGVDNDISRAGGDADAARNCNHGNNVTNESDVIHNDDATHNNEGIDTSKISSIVEVDKELSSVEKSKRVLFTDDRNIHDQDHFMDTTETSEEDKGRFERLLVEYVEATEKMNIETLELWHTRIRQCILQHKKDQSRLLLSQDLQSLLNTLKSSSQMK